MFPVKKAQKRARKERLSIENGKGGVSEVVSVDQDDVSDYEKIRLKNIAERKKMFENLKRDMMNLKKEMAPRPKFPVSGSGVVRRRRASLKYNSRSDRVLRSGRSMGQSSKEVNYTEMSDGEEGEEGVARKTRARNPNPSMWASDPNVDILQPEDVSEEMLANVADRYSDKGRYLYIYMTSALVEGRG